MELVGVVLRIRVETAVLVGDERFRIHPQIAVGIAHQPRVRWLADKHAAVEDLHRARQNQAVGEHRALVHPAVAVLVLQHDDAADRIVLVLATDVAHVAGHLDDPESSLEIPVNRHRILNQRLARDQLDGIPGREVKRLQRVSR